MEKEKISLTKGEEEVMKVLWNIGKGTVNDILARMDEPKPKYTTVATFLKLLEDKKFSGHVQKGKVNTYFPLVEEMEYAGTVTQRVLDSFFGGSLLRMVSYFGNDRKMTVREKEELLKLAQEIIDRDE